MKSISPMPTRPHHHPLHAFRRDTHILILRRIESKGRGGARERAEPKMRERDVAEPVSWTDKSDVAILFLQPGQHRGKTIEGGERKQQPLAKQQLICHHETNHVGGYQQQRLSYTLCDTGIHTRIDGIHHAAAAMDGGGRHRNTGLS